jgi:hypothetical protein
VPWAAGTRQAEKGSLGGRGLAWLEHEPLAGVRPLRWLQVDDDVDSAGDVDRVAHPVAVSVSEVGITVGSARRILGDLIQAGFVDRERHGWRNRYVVNRDAPMLRRSAQDEQEIGGLLELLRLHDHAETPPDAAG